ncbi:RPII140-upstream gene protein [Calliopsis andreniformis]|uniref:RPII140-upstream gene protein n=1 Tax=Calliopsis andreniformis TaxID=337506 RepID=UPI003FCE3F79
MYRVRNSRMFYKDIFPFLSVVNVYDTVTNKNRDEVIPGEIGINKLMKIFERNKDGHVTKELQSIISSTATGTIIGFLVGGIIKAKNGTETFIKENHATKFESKIDAQRQLQYKFLYNFFRGGTRVGIKLGAFCFLFIGAATSVYVYRGKYDVTNFTIAGAITGCLFKLNMGIKGAAAGTFAGTVLGCTYGCIACLILYISGIKMEDVYEVHANTMNARRDRIQEKIKKYATEESAELAIYKTNQMIKEQLEQQARKDPVTSNTNK